MTAPLEVALPNRRATIHLGQKLAPLLQARDLIVLSGPLGSGKTFFVRALCRAMGLPGSERVTSPTFTLVHEYPLHPSVAHADLYRLRNAAEVAALGLDALRDEGRLLLVEWGRDYLHTLGGDGLLVDFSIEPRGAAVSASGSRSRELLELLARGWRGAARG